MKVCMRDNGLLITAETEFEEAYISKYSKGARAFLKHGMTLSDVVGVAVLFDETMKEEVCLD